MSGGDDALNRLGPFNHLDSFCAEALVLIEKRKRTNARQHKPFELRGEASSDRKPIHAQSECFFHMEGSTDDDEYYFWVVKLTNGRRLRLRATQDGIEGRAQKYVDRLNGGPFEEKIDIVEWTRVDEIR